MEWFIEIGKSLLASGYAEPAILAILSVLGVRNLPPSAQAAIASFIAKMLNPKADGSVTPPNPKVDEGGEGEGDTDKKEDEPPPRRYVIVDHCHGLLEIAAEEGHADCQKKINEVQSHLLTGKGSDHVDAE